LVTAGAVTFTVTTAADGSYQAQSQTTGTLTVYANSNFSVRLPYVDGNVGDIFHRVNVTTNSPGALTYTSSDTGVATIAADGKITLVAAGSVTFTVSQAEAPGYLAQSQTTSTLTVYYRNEGATLKLNPTSVVLGDPAPTVNVITASPMPITYSSDNANVASIDRQSGIISVNSVGTAYISFRQVAGSGYAAVGITTLLTVYPKQ
jgi:hypothetical protein